MKLSTSRTVTDGKAVGKAVWKAVGERLLSHTEFQVVVGGGVQSSVCRVVRVIHQHTSAYVSIRQHTSAYVSIRQHGSGCRVVRVMHQHTSAYVSMRQHASAYVSRVVCVE
jgi:hypothetical protein